MIRTLVLWGPAWPLVAAGVGDVPSVTVSANRVTAASRPALDAGIRRGMRRRQAQSRCADLVVVQGDSGLEARAFEPVVRAIESLCTGVEVLRPGALALGTRGPSRYFGGDEALAAELGDAAQKAAPHPDSWRVGVADGVFAADLAARLAMSPALRASAMSMALRASAHRGVSGVPIPADPLVIPPRGTAEFLREQSVDHLPFPKLVGLLHRLGVHTLGRLAEMPEADLSARFGPEGVAAHRMARGDDDRPLATRRPPPDLEFSAELDPPAERVAAAAFVAKSLADDLAEELSRRGLTCHAVRVEIETEHGESISRLWRHDGPFTATAMSDRLRWQLDGWLNADAGTRPTAGISLLRLAPTAVSGGGGQRGLWGGDDAAAERAARALARVQALLGPEEVQTAVLSGGRGPGERVRLVPWGDPPEESKTAALPWPGRVPAPAPALVHPKPKSLEVVDGDGVPVRVSGRGLPNSVPAQVSIEGGPWTAVEAWAGPWTADERWWDPDPRSRHRRARVQVSLSDGTAHLCILEKGTWSLEATYG
ncbi:MAG: DNA polymerase Y family protein [Actinobacteria bacterium]|nr:DNA polymerase Y family protein [Actinomycetota bacterium]